MGKSRINRWWSPSELETEIRSGTWAKRFYLWRLLSTCRPPLKRVFSSIHSEEPSHAVHQQSSCSAHAHRARASCLHDSNPYGRDGLAHSRFLSTSRRARRVAEVGVASFINQFTLKKKWVEQTKRLEIAVAGGLIRRNLGLTPKSGSSRLKEG